jgi:hypothetical protein
MGAVLSCLPFLKSKMPQAEAALTELVASGPAELKKVVLNEVEKVEDKLAGLKLNVPDELAGMIPQVAIDDAVKKALGTIVEKVNEEVIANVDKATKELATVVENAKELVAAVATEEDKAKELAAQVKEMEKVD